MALAVGARPVAAEPAPADAAAPAAPASSPALARFAALAGEWVAAENTELAKKGDLVARWAVTAGGSAVIETVFPGAPHEMVTVYTADGPDLVLTHYCVNGNQPRMRAHTPAAGGNRFDFALDGDGGVHAAHDRHMHSAQFELVSADELRSVWTEHADGQQVFVARLHAVRRRG